MNKAHDKRLDMINYYVDDIIDMRSICTRFGYPYLGSMYVGIGDDIKFSPYVKDLLEYRMVLEWFCDYMYKVIKVDGTKAEIPVEFTPNNYSYERARKWILANYFDGDDNVNAVVGGDEECMAMVKAVQALDEMIKK